MFWAPRVFGRPSPISGTRRLPRPAPVHAMRLLAPLAFLAFTACPSPSSDTPASTPDENPPTAAGSVEATSQPTSQPSSQPGAPAAAATSATPQDAWISARVSASEERLRASEGGQLLWAAIETHGGLEQWFSNGPIHFRFAYVPVEGTPRDTVQLIDTWAARAVHHLPGDEDTRFGWTGDVAWVSNPDADLGANPRFWSLTPYYFIGVPFVLADPGVNVELEPEPIEFEGTTYDVVRTTFGDGVGDAPDDYYRVLIARDTHRIGGVRYVVSYPGFFPEGGHGAEKFMAYDGAQVIGGLTFPETFRTFSLAEDGSLDSLVTNSSMQDVAFRPETPSSAFAVPDGATTLDGW